MNLDNSMLVKWKKEALTIMKARYGNQYTDEAYLALADKIIQERLSDKNIVVVNNYTNKLSRMKLLDMIDLVDKNRLIYAGGGCLFLPHGVKDNLLAEFIDHNIDQRVNIKAKMASPDLTDAYWIRHFGMLELAIKYLINSLYGCIGYPGFTMFNVFIAEAVTNQGRQIISTAITTLEAFLGNGLYFASENECYHVIGNILKDYRLKIVDMEDSVINAIGRNIDISDLPMMCYNRFLEHSKFTHTSDYKDNLRAIFNNLSVGELILLYFKNNILEFTKLDFIVDKIADLIDHNGVLIYGEYRRYKDDKSRESIKEIEELYKAFVYYDYQVHDKVRKSLYTDKKVSLYTDTDSVFFSLFRVSQTILKTVFNNMNNTSMTDRELNYTICNIILTLTASIIGDALNRLCTNSHIPPEKAKRVKMEIEAFLERIVFMDAKKRYFALELINGKGMVKDGKGKLKIKGFDFIKSTTKPYIRKYYEDICFNDILNRKELSPALIIRKVFALRDEMKQKIDSGSMEYFKQTTVKLISLYKKPYSTQGVMAILLWNTLYPENIITFPNDVNIVPIKPLTFPKPSEKSLGKLNRAIIKTPLDYPNIARYAKEYPEAYDRLYKDIYTNENSLIRHMTLSSIAIPKVLEGDIPDHIKYIMDISSVINNATDLFLPIAKNLGIETFSVSANKEVITNMIRL